MKRKVLIGGLLMAVVILSVMRFKNRNSPEINIDEVVTLLPSPTIAEVTIDNEDDWQVYRNDEMGFEVSHPKYIKPEAFEDGSVGLVIEGPTQETATEFYDGMVVAFLKMPLEENKSLKQTVEEKINMYKDLYGNDSQISDIKSTELASISGFSFSDNMGEYYYLPIGDDNYLEIVKMVADPMSLGFEEIAKKIVDSFRLI